MVKYKLSQIIETNNVNKLIQSQHLLNKHIFARTIDTCCKYRSKDCFDFLMNLSIAKDWLNFKVYSLDSVFINYMMVENNEHLYYLNKVLNNLTHIHHNNMKIIIRTETLFNIIFNLIEKNEANINGLLRESIGINHDIFLFLYNWLEQNNPPYFNQIWIQKFILSIALMKDDLDVIKFLHNKEFNLTTAFIKDKQINSVIISLYKKNSEYKCFEWFIQNNYQYNEHLLWFIPFSDSYFSNMNYDNVYNFIGQEDLNEEYDTNIGFNCWMDNDEILDLEILDDNFIANYIKYDLRYILDFTLNKFNNILEILNRYPNYQKQFNIETETISINFIKKYIDILIEQISKIKKTHSRYNYKRFFIISFNKIINYITIIRNLIPRTNNYNPLSNNIFNNKKNKYLIKLVIYFLLNNGYELTDNTKSYFKKNELISIQQDKLKYNFNYLKKELNKFKKEVKNKAEHPHINNNLELEPIIL